MARIRTIKPDFWTDEKVVSLSPFARLVFIGLWNFVDDHGRIPCSPVKLKMQILPGDPADFPQLLAEISGAGLISIYAVDDKQFLQVNGFDKHQKIDKRAASKHPAPPNPPTSPPILPLEGKGREEEGKGNAAPSGAQIVPLISPEKMFFDQAHDICGRALAAKLLKAKDNNVALAHSALLTASTKSNPREYLGAIIRGREGEECRPDRSF